MGRCVWAVLFFDKRNGKETAKQAKGPPMVNPVKPAVKSNQGQPVKPIAVNHV
jgi:hypothetical protein